MERSKGFYHKERTILKCGRQNGRQKQGFLSKKWIFDRIKLSNIQKKSGIYTLILHKYLIWVRSTGIEDIRRYEKSLDFQAFFAIERQNFLGKV